MDIIMPIHATFCANNITEIIFKLFHLIKKWQRFEFLKFWQFLQKLYINKNFKNAAISLLIGIIKKFFQ